MLFHSTTSHKNFDIFFIYCLAKIFFTVREKEPHNYHQKLNA